MVADGQIVQVEGRRLRVTNLDKVVYPETGTTKGEIGVTYGSFETRALWANYSFPLDKDGRHSLMVYGSELAPDGPRIFDPTKFVDNVALAGGI